MVAEAGDLPQVILEINMCSVRCRSLKMQPCFMQTYIYCIYTCLCTGGGLLDYDYMFLEVRGMHSHPSSDQGHKVPTTEISL